MKNCIATLGMLLLTSILPYAAKAVVKLPRIFSDNMVLQANQPVHVWGWADQKETVTLSFNGKTAKTKADHSGKWSLTLPSFSYGGPYTMEIRGKKNEILLHNILIGEVWVCSGQSNMEFRVKEGNNATMEIQNADYPQIRFFTVQKEMSTTPLEDVQGTWQVCSPETVGECTAVGYFYGRELFKRLNVPIGLINSSWGGTDVETWISPEKFSALPEHYKKRYQGLKIDDMQQFIAENQDKRAAFIRAMNEKKELDEQWFAPSQDLSGWEKATIPCAFSRMGLENLDGIVWFTYTFTLPEDCVNKAAELSLGAIDDEDITWVNGVRIGQTNGYATKRFYQIPTGILAQNNRLTIRVTDSSNEGGINGLEEELFLKVGDKIIPLEKENWQYKIAVDSRAFNYVSAGPNMLPSLLYNAMIHPIIGYPLKGTIWYQGENNDSRAYDYRTLFPTLIKDWRAKWGSEFPFYWVQLANFKAKDGVPVDSEWAELREAQTMTLALPSTGQAVITDIGETNDIHPRNKQDVGLRLALISLNKTYGYKDQVYSGPTFQNMEIKGDKAIITFDHIDGGLKTTSKYGYVEGFAIAGADGKFVWAKAFIDGDKVIVYHENISSPALVRYAWSNNPDVNLYNGEGLPAVPFRTDSLKGITQQ